jgi:hypothetical protein
MSGLCGVGTQMFTKYKIHMATFLECCSRGRPACSYPQEDEAMPMFKNAAGFFENHRNLARSAGFDFQKNSTVYQKIGAKIRFSHF